MEIHQQACLKCYRTLETFEIQFNHRFEDLLVEVAVTQIYTKIAAAEETVTMWRCPACKILMEMTE